MTSRTVFSEEERDMAVKWLGTIAPPFQLVVTKGSKRSLQQNALTFQWYNEIAQQRDDMTVQEVRAECKLVFGVPLLRQENEAFRETYDKILKPLPYETKLHFIQVTELPVTRIMTVSQLGKYLDAIYDHFTRQGFVLTVPEER